MVASRRRRYVKASRPFKRLVPCNRGRCAAGCRGGGEG
ncbi:hypothetical protein [Azospirillum largimobile]